MAGGSVGERYQRLVQHDSHWFLNIIARGYQSPIPPSPVKRMEVSNTAFFPGFPLLGAVLIQGAGLPPKTGLALASQLATVGFWTYFLLVARELGFSPLRRAAAAGLVLAHPAAFFLIAAYSESLFLLFALGYLFWSGRPGPAAFGWAALHGFGMTFTRIAGVPAVVLPAICSYYEHWRGRLRDRWLRPFRSRDVGRGLALGGISLLGTAVFFIYCQARWGRWNLYMLTQEAGWGVRADYLALFKPAAYARWYPQWEHAWQLGQFSVPATMACFTGIAAWEVGAARRRATRWRERVGLYFLGAAFFAIAVSGVFSVRLESMTRYHLCTHVFLALGVVHAFAEIGPREPRFRRALLAAVAAMALLGAWIQWRFATQFARGDWVA